LGSALLIEIAR